MSADRLSAATRSLLKAARTDAPSAAARAKVWSSVTGTAAAGAAGAAGASAAGLGGAGGAGAASAMATAAAATSGMGAMKVLVLGTLLGGAVTVGLAATLLHVGPSLRDAPPGSTARVVAAAGGPQGTSVSPAPEANAANVVTIAATVTTAGSVLDPAAAATDSVALADSEHAPVVAAGPPPSHGHAPARSAPASRSTLKHESDPLAREAALVADARAALARGDASTALSIVRQARALPSPQLVPEELAVEGQALRMLGSADEARGVAETLRTSFPESALAH